MPITFEKKPAAGFAWVTVIWSFGVHLLLTVIVRPVTPPFFFAKSAAIVLAPAGSFGSAWAPASAAASTVDCAERC
jgi:hypothetical protein